MNAFIEPVSYCPIKCRLCAVGQFPDMREFRLFDLSLLRECLNRLRKEFKCKTVYVGNWGEPLLHPGLDEIICEIRKKDMPIFVFTSLSVKVNLKKIIDVGVDKISVSMSGWTPETYNIVHRYGNVELVKKNLKKLIKLRSKGKIKHIQLGWHRYKHNEHQLPIVGKFCQNYNIKFVPYYGHLGGIESLSGWHYGSLNNGLKEFINRNVFVDYIVKTCKKYAGRSECKQRDLLSLDSDGSLLHCCATFNSYKTSIPFLNSNREEIRKFKLSDNGYCSDCRKFGWCGYMHSDKQD